MVLIRFVAVALLVLASCGEPPLKAGLVEDREFEPEHQTTYTETTYIPVTYTYTQCYTGYNGTQSCAPQTGIRMQPVYHERCCRTVPDRWWLTVTDGKRDSRIEVGHEVFDSCIVGRQWSKEQGLCRPG